MDEDFQLNLHFSNVEGNAFKQFLQYHQYPISLREAFLTDILSRIEIFFKNLAIKTPNFASEIQRDLVFLKELFASNSESFPLDLFANEILNYNESVIELVKPILFHQSPEGILPDTDYELEFSSSQVLVATCWRTLKDFSELVAIIVECNLVSTVRKEQVSVCYKDLLLNLRHKGALLSVFNAFVSICKNICHESSLCHLPSQWINEIITSLDSISPVLSFTRRSGGIPYLMEALIICELNELKNKLILETTINSLVDIITHSKSESQIHSINILRILFKNSTIGTELISFSEKVLCICVNGFTSKDWSIRNGCLMLFSSLVLRIFGCNRQSTNKTINQITFEQFYQKYNSHLIPLIMSELQKSTQSSSDRANLHPSLFPILSLISRLTPSSCCKKYQVRNEILNFVIKCFLSPVYKLREIAASCSVALVDIDEIHLNHFVNWMLKRHQNSNNWIHSVISVLRQLKNHDLLLPIHLNMFQDTFKIKFSPLNTYLFCKQFGISVEAFSAISDSIIGKKLLRLCHPLTEHFSCDIFSQHESLSISNENLEQIFLSKCSFQCMSKCLNEMIKMDKVNLSVIECLNDIIMTTTSKDLVISGIQYFVYCFNKHGNNFNCSFLFEERLISILSFFSHPDNCTSVRWEVARGICCFKKWTAELGIILLTLIQDDDCEIRTFVAIFINKLLFLHCEESFCESMCLKKILSLLNGTVELHRYYVNEYESYLKRTQIQSENDMFEIEPSNLYREFSTELYFLSSLCENSRGETLKRLVDITKDYAGNAEL